MKKILISLMLLFSTFLFGSVESDVEKMDYVLKVEKVQYEDNEYKAYVKFEQALSDNRTLGLNVFRVYWTLKMLLIKY